MPLYFAFLRGINVGGRRLSMVELAAGFDGLGLGKVETFIASGNVVFESQRSDRSALQDDIEGHLSQKFGFKAEVFLRTRLELETIAAEVTALREEDDVAVNVALLKVPADSSVMDLLVPWQGDTERFVNLDHAFVWLAKTKMSETPFGTKGFTNKALPVMTVRTINTFERMLARWGE